MYVVYMVDLVDLVDLVDGSKTVSICGDSVFPAMRSMIQHGDFGSTENYILEVYRGDYATAVAYRDMCKSQFGIGEIPDGYVFGMVG